MAAERYHGLPQISRSQLWTFRKSPKIYHRRHVVKDPAWQITVTEEMRFGTWWHDLVLENDCNLNACVTTIPEDVLGKNGARSTNAWRDFEAKHEGEWLLRECEQVELREMVESLESNPHAAQALFGVHDNEPLVEQTLLWTDSHTDLGLRCRLDLVHPGESITDLKTCHTCDRKALNDIIERQGYYFQAGFYQGAWEVLTGERLPFNLIVSETKMPFRCVHIPLKQTWIDRGRFEAQAALRGIAERHESGDWSDPECRESVEMDEPHWSLYQPQLLLEGE